MRFIIWILFLSCSLQAYDINTIPKTKAVHLGAKIFLNHQFQLMVGFGRAKDYLCLFRKSDYTKYSNLEESGVDIGFKTIIDATECGTTELNTPWIFKSKQATTESNLEIEMFRKTTNTDTRAKLILEEETSVANPYGVLTLDYNYVFGSDSANQYNATFESKKLESNDIEFKSSVWVDGHVISGTNAIGANCEFYSSNVIHTPNSGGRGSVTSMYFVNSVSAYPDGTPNTVSTTNFVYDDNYVRYKMIEGKTGSETSDRCISRSESWSYIPAWFGYGIYDENGDLVTGTPNIVVSYTGPIQTKNNESWTGNIMISSGSMIGMTYICKKVKDGTHWSGNNVCPGTIGSPHIPVEIDGEIYENFPLLDVLEGTVLTDPANGNKYYVRQLRPRKVFSEVSMSNCSGLTIQASLETPDHKFFNYPVMSLPRSGAILVNEFVTDSSRDFAFDKLWLKDSDSDSDGIVNYLDFYPSDSNKSRDDDYDGIDDAEDTEISAFQQTWTKYLDKDLFSSYIK